jgi:ribosomal protein L11 methyltransferase
VSWLELRVHVSRANAALVENLLEGWPVLAVTLTDEADDPVLEPGVGETPLWPSVCITALFDAGVDIQALTRLLSLVPGVDRPQQVSTRKIQDQAWTRSWMDRFRPMQFGQGLWIVPGERTAPAEAHHVIRLDPGLAFGTGTHPTTRLCLQWIDGHDFSGQAVVDYGCGSGVLGIAAAVKGARQVCCVDNDPQALIATTDNAGRNSVEAIVQTQAVEQYEVGPFDVVLANILAAPLVELAPLLTASLVPGGHLVLSGILEEQVEEVSAAYHAMIGSPDVTIDEGWARLAMTAPAG